MKNVAYVDRQAICYLWILAITRRKLQTNLHTLATFPDRYWKPRIVVDSHCWLEYLLSSHVYAMVRLIRDKPVVKYSSGGHRSTRRKAPPNQSHYRISHIPGFKLGTYWETASSHWRRRPLGYCGCPATSSVNAIIMHWHATTTTSQQLNQYVSHAIQIIDTNSHWKLEDSLLRFPRVCFPNGYCPNSISR